MMYSIENPVSFESGMLLLRLPEGDGIPITHPDGTKIDGFHPGWRARFLFCGFEDIYLLELVNERGDEITWFLSPDGRRLADHVEHLPDSFLKQISETLVRWNASPGSASSQQANAAYAQLNRHTRQRIPRAGFLAEIIFCPVASVDNAVVLRDRHGSLMAIMAPSGGPVSLPAGWNARLLNTVFAPLYLLELSGPSQRSATWFLSDKGTFFGSTLDAVPLAYLTPIREEGLRRLRQLSAVTAPGEATPPDSLQFLNPDTRAAVTALFPRSDNGPSLDRLQSALAYAARTQKLFVIETLCPVANPELFQQRSAGWFIDALQNAWIVGAASALEFEIPHRAIAYQLRLDIAVVRDNERMTLSVNGYPISSGMLSRFQNDGTSLTYFIPPERVSQGRLRIEFSFEPPLEGPHAAFRLDMAQLSSGEVIAEPYPVPDNELLGHFESLGDNCELGFAQRHFGLEPISLFRFAGTRGLTRLVRLIETDFADLGAPGSLRSTVNFFRGQAEYMIWDDRAGLFYHTWRNPSDISEADVLAENEVKLAYLSRKLIEDLEDGEKIFVYKRNATRELGEILSLHVALNRHGPNKLFWITQLEDGRRSGDVEWIAPNLLKGYCASFDRAEEPPIDIWLTLCRKAHAAFSSQALIMSQPAAATMPEAALDAVAPSTAEPVAATSPGLAPQPIFTRLRTRLFRGRIGTGAPR